MAGNDGQDAEREEMYSSWSLFIVCMLLILSLWTSYYLQIKRIRAVHETVVSIFAGMFVGLLVRIGPASMIRDMLTFKHTLFFNLLLPPIILNSGYELRQDYFFRNFGAILTFAFVGTFISAVGLGLLVYVYSVLGLESLHLTLLECLLFGSALSATDPVTILAIFQQYKVDPTLYSIIFGESLLNDAVSIVLYDRLLAQDPVHGTGLVRVVGALVQTPGKPWASGCVACLPLTLSHLKKSEEIYTSHFFHGVGIFLLSFSTSMAMGVAFGLACSLVLKHSSLNLFSRIESCLIALIAYTCYFFSNGLGMSGISGEGEVFPLAPTANAGASTSSSGGGGGGQARQNSGGGRGVEGQQEGKWFHDLDQRYLLPLFSNATASRTFHARKQARKTRHTQQREQLAQQQHHDDALSDAEGGTHVWRSASTTPDGH
ncbi:hypothetical protein EXIGLDRAFT_756872 [Exidia glandulosa HHB12029]|uniref:Cation/H+ exchanger transmembrane domain-containing protein n=1 Tax=Exidia glandulosa HHB12029 TaxID=1314781 RepID=A0A165AZG1_EXIGL|nr:hypothetical protein EXIGLDRAFT_756872 [Exidia glandulosa HHB12029]